jgi:hypothetical protein
LQCFGRDDAVPLVGLIRVENYLRRLKATLAKAHAAAQASAPAAADAAPSPAYHLL